MSAERLQNLNDILGRCIGRLEETLAEPPQDLRDLAGIVKHFELAFEQSYRCTVELLLELQIEDAKRSAKVAFRRAFEFGWLSNEAVWVSMISDRNTTAHTYDEPFARDLIARIATDYIPEFKVLHAAIAREIGRLA